MKILLCHIQGRFVPSNDEARAFMIDIEEGQTIAMEVVEEKNPGTQTMLNTWMMWMQETAEFMSWQGVKMPMYIRSNGEMVGERKFEQRDAHDLFTSTYLGLDADGLRKTWSRTKSTEEIQASIGDRLHAMDTHMQWATEKGIKLTVKKDSQYMKMKEELGDARE